MNIEHRGNILRCSGALRPGAFTLPGDVSSQFISGLLMVLPMLPGDSTLNITGQLQSGPYVAMTLEALRLSRISVTETADGYHIPGGQSYDAPEMMTVEGDWSNAAPFLCMGALSRSGVAVTGLNPESVQGDRAIVQILRELGAEVDVHGDRVSVRRRMLHGAVIDAAMIPDIIPALAALAAAADGETRIVNAGRLRLKESDRLGGTAKGCSAHSARMRALTETALLSAADRSFQAARRRQSPTTAWRWRRLSRPVPAAGQSRSAPPAVSANPIPAFGMIFPHWRQINERLLR